MPSPLHEVLIEQLRTTPEVMIDLAQATGKVELPPHDKVEVSKATFPQQVPPEYSADLVALVRRTGVDRAVHGLIAEVQLGWDDDKLFTWPHYVTSLRLRERCPVTLLVITTDHELAGRLAQTIRLGPAGDITPLVLGPRSLPRIEDKKEARTHPYLTVFTVLVQAKDEPTEHQFEAFAAALRAGAIDFDHAAYYYDQLSALLPDEAARRLLEAKMKIEGYEPQSDFGRKYFSEGKAEGKAEGELGGLRRALLALIAKQGLTLSAEHEQLIRTCADPAKLEDWLVLVPQASSLDEVLGQPVRH